MPSISFTWTPAEAIDSQEITIYQEGTPTMEQDIGLGPNSDRYETGPLEAGHEYAAHVSSIIAGVEGEPLVIPKIIPPEPTPPPPTNGGAVINW